MTGYRSAASVTQAPGTGVSRKTAASIADDRRALSSASRRSLTTEASTNTETVTTSRYTCVANTCSEVAG